MLATCDMAQAIGNVIDSQFLVLNGLELSGNGIIVSSFGSGDSLRSVTFDHAFQCLAMQIQPARS